MALLFTACQPQESEMIVVTEVVHLGDEQIIITRMVEIEPTVPPTETPPVRVPEPVSLDIAYEASLPNLDPQHVSGKVGLDLVESMFAGLTNFNHETQLVEPELAESWRISGDGRTWTFLLRDDIFWARPLGIPVEDDQPDNTEAVRPVNSSDVAYAFRRACINENGVPDAFLLFVIEGCQAVYSLITPTEDDLDHLGIKVIDDQTVEFTLTEAASNFLTITTLPQFRPVPQDLVEEHGDSWRDITGELSDGWQTPDNIVVSGAFIPSVTSFNDTELMLRSNPDWPIPTSGNVDIINIRFEEDEMDMFREWQARKFDLSILPASERDTILDLSPEKTVLVTNQTVFYLGFNFDSIVFREPEIRRAFSAAIDRDDLINSMLDGRAQSLRHFSPPGVFGAPPVDEVGMGYSPDRALQQMDLSSMRSCKLIPPITMLVSTADLSLLQAELIRDMWIRELGCDEQTIEINQVEFGDLLANTSRSTPVERPDIWELAWPAYYPDAHNLLGDLLHCTQGENRQNRSCSDVDQLIREAKITPNPEERIELYRAIENGFFADDGSFPVIPLYVRGDYTLVQSWLNFPPALSGGEQFETYQIDQELKRLERSRS